MNRIDHLSAWALVGVMMVLGFTWSLAFGTDKQSFALDGDRAYEVLAASRRALPPSPAGWDLGITLGRSAAASLEFERFDERQPARVRAAEAAAAHSAAAASTTSRNPIKMCLSVAGRECRAAGRQTPQPLSSQEPPLTM